jgi:hypothetical protein
VWCVCVCVGVCVEFVHSSKCTAFFLFLVEETMSRIDDCVIVFDKLPGKGSVKPDIVTFRTGVLYVVPASARTRGPNRMRRSSSHVKIKDCMSLEWVGEADAILFCCGSNPTEQKAIKDALVLAFDNTVLAYFKWTMPTPVMQKTGKGFRYIEYLLLARGAKCTFSDMPPWLGEFPAYLPKSQRHACELQSRTDTVDCGCPTSVWARKTCCTPLPQFDNNLHVADGSRDDLNMQKLLGDPHDECVVHPSNKKKCIEFSDTDEATSGEKSDGEGPNCSSASVAQSNTTTRDTGVVNSCGGAPPLQTQASSRLTANSAWRNGMHSDAWAAIIGGLSPSVVVLVTALHTQPGLILGSLTHNDKRFGVPQCPLVCFHPHGSLNMSHHDEPAYQRKCDRAAHAADHVLKIMYTYCVNFHDGVKRVTRPRVGPTQRKLTRSASHASVDEVGDGTADGAISYLDLLPLKYIQVPGNHGRNGVTCTIAGRSDEDSDDDASGGTAFSMDSRIVSLRNVSAISKYGVHIKASLVKKDAGSGLFAARDLASGHEIQVKGPIFETVESLHTWIAEQPTYHHDFIGSSAHCITYLHDEHISKVKLWYCKDTHTHTHAHTYSVYTRTHVYTRSTHACKLVEAS